MSSLSTHHNRIRIKPLISCPHCRHGFATDQILFISEAPDLLGDTKLGSSEQLRFLPTRFALDGAALVSREIACHNLACPNCHLPIPRSLLSTSNFCISIVGAPASGKTYFLTSMVWQLRKTMPQYFYMNFTDADPTMNKQIREYEATQFEGGGDPNLLVAIEKTEVQGDTYNNTFIDGLQTTLVQPFSYIISPLPDYPFPKNTERIAQTVCMYDNAGESFLPGADNIQSVTQHLAASDAILFLFDPTQDLRFKSACKQPVNDPQMNSSETKNIRRSKVNQSTVLTEMIMRIRAHKRLPVNEKITIPLIIVLTKLDAWSQLLHLNRPLGYHLWKPVANNSIHVFNTLRVEQFSAISRRLLLDLIPEFVGTAEANAENVVYLPVSAAGTAPELGDPDSGGKQPLLFRPSKIEPIWVEIPFLQAQIMAGKYCVPIPKNK